ncbi:MAG TPA: PocR ligand-binding domain-containing protein [Anaerolineaceae bacterium]|nr:PocR ligand-binding domain-containing protein [Anaerolineaceae bacterium]
MDDLLTTRQVLEILKVDRITIYRMLNDGRIKGVKVGQQWRFPKQEVDRIVKGETSSSQVTISPSPYSIPTHCVQTIQDLFAEVGQVSALVIDLDGTPLTEISNPCRFCQILMQSPSGQTSCQNSWKDFARESRAGSRFLTCRAGIQYLSAPIFDEEQPVGYFLAGEFHWQSPDPQEERERMKRLAKSHNVPFEILQQASRAVPVIDAGQHSRVESWPTRAARAIQSILRERAGFIDRLNQIANLTQID